MFQLILTQAMFKYHDMTCGNIILTPKNVSSLAVMLGFYNFYCKSPTSNTHKSDFSLPCVYYIPVRVTGTAVLKSATARQLSFSEGS